MLDLFARGGVGLASSTTSQVGGPQAGKIHALIYDATFEHGPATVYVNLRESGSALLVERLLVESPRFDQIPNPQARER